MKRTVSVLIMLTIILTLSACGNGAEKDGSTEKETTQTEEAEVDVQTIMDEIKKAGYFPKDYVTLQKADLLDYYGLSADIVKQCAVIQNTSGYQDEIIIIKSYNDSSAEVVSDLLDSYLRDKTDEMRDYDATQYAILQKCAVSIQGEYVALFISEHQKEMNKIFDANF